MKHRYIFLVLLGVIVILLSFYANKLHALAVEGNRLFAQRCTTVNPLLIGYKNSFLNMADGLNNPGKYSVEEMRKYWNDYRQGMNDYVAADTAWIEKDDEYMKSRDFQLFMPGFMKKAADLQRKMYEGYRDDAKYMLQVTGTGDSADIEARANQQDARARRDKYDKEYADWSETVYKMGDLRMEFLTLPAPEECTSENTTIPNTSGALDKSPAQFPIPNPENSG